MKNLYREFEWNEPDPDNMPNDGSYSYIKHEFTDFAELATYDEASGTFMLVHSFEILDEMDVDAWAYADDIN